MRINHAIIQFDARSEQQISQTMSKQREYFRGKQRPCDSITNNC
jgi:hypothetical protein